MRLFSKYYQISFIILLSELKQYKVSPVITQCKSGGRSAQAFDILKLAGFTKVYNMDGGILAWDKAGLKTE